MIQAATSSIPYILINDINNIPNLTNKKLLFIGEIDEIGYDIPLLNFFKEIIKRGSNALIGSVGGILLHSSTDGGTKRFAQDIIYLANNLGCTFIGHPLVEAINKLRNFHTWQKTLKLPLENICADMCFKLSNRILDYEFNSLEHPKFLVLYSSPHKSSNTLDLWHMISKHLDQTEIKELQIESGQVLDCKGCPYTLCLHYAKKNTCFYGGIMTEDVLPSIEESNVIVWLCPNYNDAIAANLTAVINRLTVLYRKINFYDKTIFAVIISGNSGSDSLSKQLIGALNINKGFRLSPYFSIQAIANDPDSIKSIDNIDNLVNSFSNNIITNI